ncbi:NADP-binding protein [Pseudoalteromonas piscicida]|uniref:NADP-binding protein n=1 Tax=Pseudoalteromonas piscicida TaxID=43662 RepID=A0A2A5JVR6_PSEO7|nr:NADP-binding protein [Pseudoalteromonas piscicida]PCK33508.1 NADP-binding protein [Pseudoalteromonas piscicida]
MKVLNRSVVVLGAGWLGEAICQKAQLQGWQIEGTRTKPDHSHTWSRQFVLTEQGAIKHSITLKHAYWICAIPPRARQIESNYLETLEQALSLAKQMSAEGFLLCSSTGVYSTAEGEYDEQGELADKSNLRVNILRSAEELVLKSGGKVVRLAGLQGPNREPGRFVAGKALSSSANGRVNMVHRDDVVAAINCIVTYWQQAADVYNICYPAHPTRAAFYQRHCEKLGNPQPSFASSTVQARIIKAERIAELGFEYRYPI